MQFHGLPHSEIGSPFLVSDRRSDARTPMPGMVIGTNSRLSLIKKIRNVSVTGLAAEGQYQKCCGSFLSVQFSIPGSGEWVQVDGVVIRQNIETGEWALRFLSLNPTIEDVLFEYVQRQISTGLGFCG